jgi:ElaB/YqjD/DUF883 family membrane-anchored ribosome-binding protein
MGGNGSDAIGGEGVPEGLLSSPGHSRMRDEVIERVRALPDTVERLDRQFVKFVREQPLVALGAAAGVGYVLGRVLRRWT